MAKNHIGNVSDLKPGETKLLILEGKSILLANIGGDYYAIGAECTHMGCNLIEGNRVSSDVIECQCHNSQFNLKTGAVITGPATEPEPAFKVEKEGEDLFISL